MSQNLLDRVLVATDFSDGAERALRRALQAPLGPKATVTLAHVLPKDIPGQLRAQAIRDAEARLAALVAGHRAEASATVELRAEVLEGAPAKQLVRRASELDAELLVLGRHGRRPMVDFFVGSTAQKVLRQGAVPVLLVRTSADTSYQRVLVGLALESGAPRVLKASRLVAPAAAVEAFHASHVLFEDYVALSGDLSLIYREEAIREATTALESLVTKCRLDASIAVKGGDARVLLLEEAQAYGAQLMVVGTHARKGLERLVLGSVAEWILARAPTDVLVVRT
jgi:nucleotide-binding universal stress UspA family protein